MKLGQRLLDLRKSKNLSQEEVAEKLDVTRQTISKWETDGSTPDFDKIIPLCNLYGITPDELLTGNKSATNDNLNSKEEQITKKKARGIGLGILLYFIAVVWIMISIPVIRINPIIGSSIFLLICGIGTFIIVYTCIIYKKKHQKIEDKNYKVRKQLSCILSIIFAIIYLTVSFLTMAWHITWILWVVYGLINEILKLIFILRGNNEK